jgi:large conductance mechanosensitive channel
MRAHLPKVPDLTHLPHIPYVKIDARSLWSEFKNFAFKGNMIELAIAVVIGGAFSGVVNSLVKDVVLPSVGYLLPSNMDYQHWQLGSNKDIKIGEFIGQIIHFLIVAVTVFIVMVKFLGALMRQAALVPPPPEPTTRDCPMCLMQIPVKARKCGHCTSELEAAPAAA